MSRSPWLCTFDRNFFSSVTVIGSPALDIVSYVGVSSVTVASLRPPALDIGSCIVVTSRVVSYVGEFGTIVTPFLFGVNADELLTDYSDSPILP